MKDRVGTAIANLPFSAELVDCQEVEVAGDEHVFVALWKRPDGSECGTHRVVINAATDESMAVWGHYFRGADALDALAQGSKDYDKRRAEGI